MPQSTISFSSTVVSLTALAGEGSMNPEEGRLQCQRRAEPDTFFGRRRQCDQTGHRPAARSGDPGRAFLRRRRHHRGGHQPEGCRIGVHHRLRAGQGQVGQFPNRQSTARRARAADPAAAGRLPVSRQNQVRGIPLRATSIRKRQPSWPTPRYHGAWTPLAAR